MGVLTVGSITFAPNIEKDGKMCNVHRLSDNQGNAVEIDGEEFEHLIYEIDYKRLEHLIIALDATCYQEAIVALTSITERFNAKWRS